MNKSWDPNVELSILASEPGAFVMARILETVKPFFKRAGAEVFCDRAIKDFKMLGELLAEQNRKDGISKSDLVPEYDPNYPPCPAPGDWFLGHCGSVGVNMGELMMVHLASGFLTTEQKKEFGTDYENYFLDMKEFMGDDLMVLLGEKPDDADYKDCDKYWALCDVYDEEHPENVEERERANKEYLEDKAWWESYQRGEESIPEEAEDDIDEDEY